MLGIHTWWRELGEVRGDEEKSMEIELFLESPFIEALPDGSKRESIENLLEDGDQISIMERVIKARNLSRRTFFQIIACYWLIDVVSNFIIFNLFFLPIPQYFCKKI